MVGRGALASSSSSSSSSVSAALRFRDALAFVAAFLGPETVEFVGAFLAAGVFLEAGILLARVGPLRNCSHLLVETAFEAVALVPLVTFEATAGVVVFGRPRPDFPVFDLVASASTAAAYSEK